MLGKWVAATCPGEDILANILAVDDEQMILTVLKGILNRAGHTVATATDGIKALEQIEKSRPDLVVSDIRMCPMDGLELLREIKKRWHNLPVMMLTAFSPIETIEEAAQLGVAAYLTKPFLNEDILDAVSRTLDAQRSEDGKDKD
jgi:DNA-binding NtrC family response regulator